jgi:hypothetical protein
MQTSVPNDLGSEQTWSELARCAPWFAIVIVGAIVGQLAFYLYTGTIPRAGFAMPTWFAPAMAIVATVAASRAHGLLRLAFVSYAFAHVVPMLPPLATGGWVAWTIRQGLMLITCCSLFLVAPVRSKFLAAAVLVFAIAVTYGAHVTAYTFVRNATDPHSIMSRYR